MPEPYFFNTSPNDSPGEGMLHEMALTELQKWEEIAATWPTFSDEDYLRCGRCHQAIARELDRHGMGYGYSDEQVLSLTVAHLRQAHSEVIHAID